MACSAGEFSALNSLLGGGPAHADLLSFLLFDEVFIRELIDQGIKDAVNVENSPNHWWLHSPHSAAAALLGIRTVVIGDEPDGSLGVQDSDRLVKQVIDVARDNDADGLLVFDSNGVTGHPDHRAATSAAVAAAAELDLPVLAWVLPVVVTTALRTEHDVDFHGRTPAEIDLTVHVNRDRQLRAVAAHPSQAVPGSVMCAARNCSATWSTCRSSRPCLMSSETERICAAGQRGLPARRQPRTRSPRDSREIR